MKKTMVCHFFNGWWFMENDLLEKIITLSILAFWFLFPLGLFLSILQSDGDRVEHPFHFVSKGFKFSFKKWAENHENDKEVNNSNMRKAG